MASKEIIYDEAARQSPKLRVESVQPFYADADYIEALYAVTAPYLSQPHDLLLFSYHGIPERHLRMADSSKGHCLKVADCCTTCSPIHATCYKAQCLATTRALVAKLGIPASLIGETIARQNEVVSAGALDTAAAGDAGRDELDRRRV